MGLKMNYDIRATEVRVIADDGEMLGVFSVPDAVRLAEGRGLDLIEIAPTAKPPTCKIMDYGRFKYENKKKQTEARKKQVIVLVKEIQLRPRTEDHDLEIKSKYAKCFLLGGDKVKVNLKFSGREMAHQEQGYELINRFAKMLDTHSILEVPPQKEGRQLYAIIAPDPVKIKDIKKRIEKEKKELAKAAAAVDKKPEEETTAEG
jgi:translation initiation factor IF-3